MFLVTVAYGSSDSHGAMVMNRYYQPYYPRALGGGMAAFMFQQPQKQPPTNEGYSLHDKRRQTSQTPDSFLPQENEVLPPLTPEEPAVSTTKQPELIETTERSDATTPLGTTTLPELLEPETEEVEEQPRKRVAKKKQARRPVDDYEDDESAPRMPAGSFFPMYFGWGSRSSHSGPPGGGVVAIANAYSTGRGGVSSSHATAYGGAKPDEQGPKLLRASP